MCWRCRARFESLESIPTLWAEGPPADATLYPARTGFADLLAVFKQPGESPAWMTAINRDEHYLWFSLKDPAVLPATLFWIENHGRHASPWNGRNRCLGLEDLCSYFADGLAPSVEENLLTREGIRTVVELEASRPTEIRYIQGAAPVPEGFDEVATLTFRPGAIVVTAVGGGQVTIPVQHEYLRTGRLR